MVTCLYDNEEYIPWYMREALLGQVVLPHLTYTAPPLTGPVGPAGPVIPRGPGGPASPSAPVYQKVGY